MVGQFPLISLISLFNQLTFSPYYEIGSLIINPIYKGVLKFKSPWIHLKTSKVQKSPPPCTNFNNLTVNVWWPQDGCRNRISRISSLSVSDHVSCLWRRLIYHRLLLMAFTGKDGNSWWSQTSNCSLFNDVAC